MTYRTSDIIFNKINDVFPSEFKSHSSLKYLLTVRASELAFIKLSKLKRIRGPLHTSVGQEAVAVSVCANLKKEDGIFSNHRGHGHYLSRFNDIKGLMLQKEKPWAKLVYWVYTIRIDSDFLLPLT